MIKYVHGSEDSLDVDVLYVFDKMPFSAACKEFCSDTNENRNIIVVESGIVIDCFKGTIDEINNGLLETYNLHEQSFENIVTKKVERDLLIKAIRVMRCLLSHCSRTQYRNAVKKAVKSNSWKERIEILSTIDFTNINDFNKIGSKKDVYKVFAFQLGQVLALFNHKELYTKSSIAKEFPLLKEFLYRHDNVNVKNLNLFVSEFLSIVSGFDIEESEEFVYFKDFEKKINLRNEQYL
ncbi:gp208 [Bacillus phage G]|uniref:Gp208 n=1 Tax=Bacillus phage G TaxID=2884420 RepID=G3MBS4_9CAUD|nr:gp208 [Bacillus phage G]AEO93467.1 gp208 [Bacillus phage G]